MLTMLVELVLNVLIWIVVSFLIVLAISFLIFLIPFMVLWGGLQLYIWLFVRRWSALRLQVAVFGESGSGKTMLLTTFYGHQQAARFKDSNGYWLTAKDAGQGAELLGTYYRLENDLVPPGTRFRYTTYDFDFRARDMAKPFGFVRWYDYPGGWWTESRDGEEQRRKADLVKSLVGSDIALFLVDGQKFRQSGENYLRRLFAQFRDELSRQREILLPLERRKLRRYPSIWVICLSKADLFDGYSAEDFRKQVLQCAADEIGFLRDELRSMVRRPDLVSIGEEFLLLSSAEFDPGSQHVKDPTKTIGIDLIAPISLSAPAHHARRRAEVRRERAGVLRRLVNMVRSLSVGWMKYMPFVGNMFWFFDDSMKKMIGKLDGLEAEMSVEGGVFESAAAKMKKRLTVADAQRVYLGVDVRRA